MVRSWWLCLALAACAAEAGTGKPGTGSGSAAVHVTFGSDSKVPMRDRVYEFISDGVDMIVATDHNVVSDYAPVKTPNEIFGEVRKTAPIAVIDIHHPRRSRCARRHGSRCRA